VLKFFVPGPIESATDDAQGSAAAQGRAYQVEIGPQSAKRLRRAAKRRGLDIRKSRTRDPRDSDYDRWVIIDLYENTVVAGTDIDGRPNMTLTDVEAWLMKEG
jgi:hypothetical protein